MQDLGGGVGQDLVKWQKRARSLDGWGGVRVVFLSKLHVACAFVAVGT